MMQEFVQQIKNIIRKEIRGIHTALPGKIESFDADKCLATVLPSMKYKKPDGTKINFPKISGVPVVFPQVMNQGATIAYPIEKGDSCLLIVSEQSIDYWMYERETDTDLQFDLSNAICIPGMFAKPNKVMKEACEQKAVIIDVKGTRATIKDKKVQIDLKENKIEISQDEIKITTPQKVSVETKKIELTGDVDINGNLKISGNETVTGTVTAQGDVIEDNSISLDAHTYPGHAIESTGTPQ